MYFVTHTHPFHQQESSGVKEVDYDEGRGTSKRINQMVDCIHGEEEAPYIFP